MPLPQVSFPCRLVAIICLGIALIAKVVVVGVLVTNNHEVPQVLMTLGLGIVGALIWIIHNDPIRAKAEGKVEGIREEQQGLAAKVDSAVSTHKELLMATQDQVTDLNREIVYLQEQLDIALGKHDKN